MYCIKQITDDMAWVGGSDRRLELFENVFPIPKGISYNSFLITDEKCVLLDTVDKAIGTQLFENIEYLLAGRKLDYLVVNHMEPDHCATMAELVMRYPDMKIVGTAKTMTMIKQFFTFDIESRSITVKEGDTLNTGRHNLTFLMAPMVHWPEVMVTYDPTDKILYSADAFGTFGAINGNLFADELNFESEWLPEARRYYSNIVGKYGPQVQSLLKKTSSVEIKMICPLHGPVWRRDTDWFIGKYNKWSNYTPEEEAVMIAYGTIYGGTENVANVIATKLADAGVRNVTVYDVAKTHPSEILSECFRCSHLVFASASYNAGIFGAMETLLSDLKAHNLQNRTVALVQNGSWAPTSGEIMLNFFKSMKNITLVGEMLTVKSTLKVNQMGDIDTLVKALTATMKLDAQATPNRPMASATQQPLTEGTLDVMYKISYGLYVLTARKGDKDNGCIINTVTQITDDPKRISIAVNKSNYTHDIIAETGLFTISVLTEEVPFKVFEHFGFQSGKSINKFEKCETECRDSNGILYVPKYTNGYISAKVVAVQDFGTHSVFTADVTETKSLGDKPSITYSYYFDHTKPKPQKLEGNKKGWVCKICGYVYEGEVLPPDYICPLCKHGVEDFEPLQ